MYMSEAVYKSRTAQASRSLLSWTQLFGRMSADAPVQAFRPFLAMALGDIVGHTRATKGARSTPARGAHQRRSTPEGVARDMSRQRRRGSRGPIAPGRQGDAARPASSPSRLGSRSGGHLFRRRSILAAFAALVTVGVISLVAFAALSNNSGAAAGETRVQARGGQWTDVTPDRLAAMLVHKDFTFVNVKTPYVGEIPGTDRYVPYDQLASRAAELPGKKTAKILVYCRAGNESKIAAQTLLDLGYTNVYNLAGGMEAWTASGRTIVNLNRS